MPRATIDAEQGVGGARRRLLRALARLRPRTAARRAAERQALCEAVLIAAGEHRLGAVSVGDLCARTHLSRLSFHAHFDDVGECFAAAHAVELERLAEAALAAGREAADWPAGFRAALTELGGRLEQRPNLYRGLLVEGRISGAAALAEREAVLARLSAAIDSARVRLPEDRQPPPITATFLIAAVESTAVRSLEARAPERFAAAVRELSSLARELYLQGEERAGDSPPEDGG